MKQLLYLAGLMVVLLVGCSNPPVADTGKLEKTFKSSEPALQTFASNVTAAIQATNYPAAMATLQKLSHQPKLTADQKQVVLETMTAVQQLITANRPSSGR